MEKEIYTNEYGKEEKCSLCNKNYVFYEMDKEEPLKIYKCECGKKQYKSIGNYEG